MAHQWVHAMNQNDTTPHGPAFQQACSKLGISHSATFHRSKPTGLQAKLEKCLALSQSDNPHEAALAMKKAQELAERCFEFNPEDQSPFASLYLASFSRRRAIDKVLAALIHQFFGVYAVWVESEKLDGTSQNVLEISGMPKDLEIAEYIWNFLRAELERLWKCQKKNRIQGSKREFQLGVLSGIRSQLTKSDYTGSALVLLRDEALGKFVRARLGRLSRGRGSRFFKSEAYQNGVQQGRELNIHSPIKDKKILSIG